MNTRWIIIAALGAGAVALIAVALLFAGPYLGRGKSGTPGALATVQYLANPDSKLALTAPTGATITFAQDPGSGTPVARLSGIKSNAIPGGLPGIYLPLPESFERTVSGRTVVVKVTARRAPDAPNATFAVAYSTNEVGNSGWRRFELTDELTTYAFTFDVARLASGMGEFVGILPDPTGASGAVEISEITVEAFERGQVAAPAN